MGKYLKGQARTFFLYDKRTFFATLVQYSGLDKYQVAVATGNCVLALGLGCSIGLDPHVLPPAHPPHHSPPRAHGLKGQAGQ